MNLYECRAIKQSIKEGLAKGLPWCDKEILTFYEKKEQELLHEIKKELALQGLEYEESVVETIYHLTK